MIVYYVREVNVPLTLYLSTRKEIWGNCCVRCSSAASPWLKRSCSATFETAVASKSGTALLSCMWERCGPKAKTAVVHSEKYLVGSTIEYGYYTDNQIFV